MPKTWPTSSPSTFRGCSATSSDTTATWTRRCATFTWPAIPRPSPAPGRSSTSCASFEVHVLEPGDLEMPWKHAAETPGTDLAAALGTAMALYSESAEQQGPNLIESALAQQREPMRPILIRSLMPIAAVLLVAATLLVLAVSSNGGEMASLRAELEELAPAVRPRHRAAAQARRRRSQARRSSRRSTKQLPQPDWQQILSRISQSMPDDVWLDRLTVHDGQSAALTGASYTDGGVYDFVGYLKQVPDIAEIALEGTGVGQSATGPTTNFDLQLTLANFAGRSEKEGRHD